MEYNSKIVHFLGICLITKISFELTRCFKLWSIFICRIETSFDNYIRCTIILDLNNDDSFSLFLFLAKVPLSTHPSRGSTSPKLITLSQKLVAPFICTFPWGLYSFKNISSITRRCSFSPCPCLSLPIEIYIIADHTQHYR